MKATLLLLAAFALLGAGELNLTISAKPPARPVDSIELSGMLVGLDRKLIDTNWEWFFDGSSTPSQERRKNCVPAYPCQVNISDSFAAGFHTVTLKIFDRTDELVETIATILMPKVLNNCSIAAASFLATNATGNFSVAVADANLTGDLTATWSFGDGGSETPSHTAQHAFQQSGLYMVDVLLQNALSSCHPTYNLLVLDPVTGLRVIAPDVMSSDTLVQFNTTIAQGSRVRYSWNFGDSEVLYDGGIAPSHTFRQPGEFTVTVIAYNAISSTNVSLQLVVHGPSDGRGTDTTIHVTVPVLVSVFTVLLLAALVVYHRWYYRTRTAELADFSFARPLQRPMSVRMRLSSLLASAQTHRKYDTFDDDDDDERL